MTEDYIVLRTQGYTPNRLFCWLRFRCGDIEDGIGLNNNDGGSWAISFEDLERLYLAAKKVRGLS